MCFHNPTWIVRPSMGVMCVVDCAADQSSFISGESVESIHGGNLRLVCNQWQNSRCMALSPGCKLCTHSGWNRYKMPSCNVRHARLRGTPRCVDSFRVLIAGVRFTISRIFSCSSTCRRARADITWELGSLPRSHNVLNILENLKVGSSLSLSFPSFVRLIDVFNTLLVFSTLLSLL
jgi:hypothetical protein